MALTDMIEPGSTEYGDRGPLEQGLGQMGSPGSAPPGAPASGDPAGMLPPAGDPLEALLSGELGTPDGPQTAGLSVGPGPGPAAEVPFTDDVSEKLRVIADTAKTPRLRAMARAALRRRIREGL